MFSIGPVARHLLQTAAASACLVAAGLAPVLAADPPAPDRSGAVSIFGNPSETMAAMAGHLDKEPNVIVLMLEKVPITQGEMADVIRAMPVGLATMGMEEVSRRALDVLVGQKAMYLNAMKLGLDKDPLVVRRIAVTRDRALADAWLLQQTNAAVTDDALRARYLADIAGRPGAAEVRARLIVVPTADEAEAIAGKLRAGADFAELARKHSQDTSAPKGGDLGYLPIESVAPDLGAAMFSMAPGQISAFPVATPGGFYLLRIEGRRQRATLAFEDAKPALERILRGEAANRILSDVMAKIKMARPPK